MKKLTVMLAIWGCFATTALARKNVIVQRDSGPWLETVFTDGAYGGLVGALGYGAYGLVVKDFNSESLGTSIGIGIGVGLVAGIFDATLTESVATIDQETGNLAFHIPKPEIMKLGSEVGVGINLIKGYF